MSARLLLIMLGAGVCGALVLALITLGEYQAEKAQYDRAIIQLNEAIREARARHEHTSRMLAETARQRADAVRRADHLATELRDLGGSDACLTAHIDPVAAERVRQYRASPPASEGAGAASLD